MIGSNLPWESQIKYFAVYSFLLKKLSPEKILEFSDEEFNTTFPSEEVAYSRVTSMFPK